MRNSDPIDDAAETAQFFLDLELQNQRQTSSPLHPRGTCYNCDDPVEGLFCDDACRDDYDKRLRVHRKTHFTGAIG